MPAAMKSLFVSLLAAFAAGNCQAGPTDKAILAAMKLSEQPNYAWSCVVNDDARSYDIEGKVDRCGWTWMRLPMVKAIARRLGRDADTQIEAVFKSADMFVIRTDDGWKQLGELPKRHRDWTDGETMVVMPHHPSGGWGMAGGSMLDPNDPFAHDPFPMLMHVPVEPDTRPYSNAQFGMSHPHDELAIVVSTFAAMNVEGSVASGVLSDLGAQLLLIRDGQDHIQTMAAAGAFKLFMHHGIVTRYQLRLEGVLLVDRKRVRVRQISDTQIRSIGATTIEIPDEARRKLGE